MERKSAPRTRTRAAMEFSSFRNAIGTETTINSTMSEACRRLTPLSRSYKARATKIKPADPMSWAAMPRRKSVSEAAMLLAVAAAFPWTMSLLGTYIMAKKPGMDMRMYSRPANLPGFLVELMVSSLVVRGLVKGSTGETPEAVEMFRDTQFRKLLLYPSVLGPCPIGCVRSCSRLQGASGAKAH